MPEFKKAGDGHAKKQNHAHTENNRANGEELNDAQPLSEESGEVRDEDQDQVMSGDGGNQDVDISVGNNKIDAGLDCSDIDYFNIMKSGGWVTRNRIRKEK